MSVVLGFLSGEDSDGAFDLGLNPRLVSMIYVPDTNVVILKQLFYEIASVGGDLIKTEHLCF